MPGAEWPLWTEKEIDGLSQGYIKDIMLAREEYGAFAAGGPGPLISSTWSG
jgi:hypothetical protein